jgi:hypothetical protein
MFRRRDALSQFGVDGGTRKPHFAASKEPEQKHSKRRSDCSRTAEVSQGM